MDRADRVKQFMPFAALKGYEEAIREREHIIIERSELSEERLDELDDRGNRSYKIVELICKAVSVVLGKAVEFGIVELGCYQHSRKNIV